MAADAADFVSDVLVGQSGAGQGDGQRVAGGATLFRIELPVEGIGRRLQQFMHFAGSVGGRGAELLLALQDQRDVRAGKVEILVASGVAGHQHEVIADLVVELDSLEGVRQAVGELAGPVLALTEGAEIEVVLRGQNKGFLQGGDGLVILLGLRQVAGLLEELLVLAGALPTGRQRQRQNGDESDDAVAVHDDCLCGVPCFPA